MRRRLLGEIVEGFGRSLGDLLQDKQLGEADSNCEFDVARVDSHRANKGPDGVQRAADPKAAALPNRLGVGVDFHIC